MRFTEFRIVEDRDLFQIDVPKGRRGPEVRDVQQALLALGYSLPRRGADGIRGPETIAAVKAFQQANQLTVDGDPGPETVGKLNDILKTKPEITGKLIKSLPTDVKEPTRGSFGSDGPVTPAGQPVVIGDEKRTGGTVSWRTNNPGNVSYGDLAKQYGAIGTWKNPNGDTQQRTTGIAIMPTMEAGIQLQMALWRKPNYNNHSIGHGVSRWTGQHQGPDSAYAISLAQAAGATPDTRVADLSDAQLRDMLKVQNQWEGFKVGRIEPATNVA
jgi:hypothetical protein